jgi:hypothetical protein
LSVICGSRGVLRLSRLRRVESLYSRDSKNWHWLISSGKSLERQTTAQDVHQVFLSSRRWSSKRSAKLSAWPMYNFGFFSPSASSGGPSKRYTPGTSIVLLRTGSTRETFNARREERKQRTSELICETSLNPLGAYSRNWTVSCNGGIWLRGYVHLLPG